MIRRILHGALLASLGLVTACASTESDKLRANVEIVRRETRPDVLLAKGEAYEAVGDSTRSEQYLATAIAAGGDEAVLMQRIIRVCVADRRFRAALAYADDYLRRHPGDRDMRFAHGAISAAIGEGATARADLRALVRGWPDDPEYHFALAILLRDEPDEAAAAREQFALYLKLDPNGKNAEMAHAELDVVR
jgi:Flp pilus assembly protein TadD